MELLKQLNGYEYVVINTKTKTIIAEISYWKNAKDMTIKFKTDLDLKTRKEILELWINSEIEGNK